jgi:glycine cleavage system aminomethyltransferase T/glycine/D-amino acid oxidase-like deaminating enzyme
MIAGFAVPQAREAGAHMTGPRVVVIGAGVVGAALADELAMRGWDDVTVVDQGALPSPGGSSSHAPGLVFQTNGSKAMSELARYTVEKLSGLDLDGEPCYLPVGGLEVATTPDRLTELYRRHGWATSWGLDARVVSPQECLELYPLLDPGLVLGGLHLPTDGVAKAVRAVVAQLRRARERGARVLENHEVLEVLTAGGRVTGVRTDHGDLPADVVVCCAGIWGPRVTATVGMDLPLVPLAHQLAWTSAVPAMAGATAEIARPILRHQGADLYVRDRFDQVGIGSYGHRPMPVAVEEIGRPSRPAERPGMPSVLPFTPADFEPAWAQSLELLPALREARVAEAFNGLFSFTTDDFPLLGPSRDVEGFWVAEAVWVTHSAGVGRAVAQWLVDGESTVDLHECDVNRFEAHHLAPDYVLARGQQNFVEVYDVKHPLQPMEDPRPLRTSPFHPRQVELGAEFLEFNGWERPQWYAANEPLVEGRDVPVPDAWAARYWSPIAAAEAQVTRERVAMYDMTALKRLEVSGPGAAAFLQRVCTGNVDKSVGSVTYCLLLHEDGGVHSDVTVARLADDRFQVGANGQLDLDRLVRLSRQPAAGEPGGQVTIRDITPGTCCVGLWGPRARDVLQPLTTTDVSNEAFGYFRARDLYVGHVPVTALRLSYVGELGWELYTSADLGLKLWDTLWAAGQAHGVIAGGRAAFNGLRLEKGYRSFGADLTFEHDPWEAGLGFAVRLQKESFVGRDAVVARREDVRRRLTCLTLPRDAATGLDGVVLGKEPVYDGDRCVGYVTSASYGYTIGTGIAYAWLPADLAEPGQELTVGWFDRRLRAVVTAEPLVDPEMKRLRG